MLLRLFASLIERKRKGATEPTPAIAAGSREIELARGAAVLPDGSARPALRIHVADQNDLRTLDVDSNPELRSAALFQSHFITEASPAALFELHRRYGRLLEDEVAKLPPLRLHVDADPHRRLRIAYVSPNFGSHSVSYFIEPVLGAHDRAAFEVYAYHTGPHCDETTDRIEASVDVWRQVDALSDDALARLIVDDSVDIAVDLAGHTLFGRLAVFARRAAPLQMTWIGYPDTTGLQSIDYRITDAIADPMPGADARHTERLVRLPGTFLCYSPPIDAPPVSVRESRDEVVFCSFNTLQKVNDEVIALWSRVLREVPRSRMIVKAGRVLAQEPVAARLRDQFRRHGIDPSRLELRDWIEEREDHLALYGEADIALDTWPYNGTTTTCEALWMGVPVVTLAGEAHMSRVGASLLTAVGLPDLITNSRDDFVKAAVSLANDGRRRGDLRAALRQKLAGSPLLDAAGFTSELETALREAWIARCSREPG